MRTADIGFQLDWLVDDIVRENKNELDIGGALFL